MPREQSTRHSDATVGTHTSIGDSTMSSFDPEHEALVSTRQLDGLQERKSNANKDRDSMRQEPDYVINTSAIERAFPQFSPGPSSEEDASDDDISIEVGRGPNRPQYRLDDSRGSVMSIANGVRSSSPAVRLDYPALQSQPLPKSVVRSVPKRLVTADSLRKDAQIRRASLKENIDPQTTRAKTSTAPGPRGSEHRRTLLSEMHAKVRETYDGSYIGDERPPTVTVNARTTRFGQTGELSAQIAEAVDKASRDAQLKDTRGGRFSTNLRSQPTNVAYNSNAFVENESHPSFLLPDLPNLSELVSGVFEDGTPVFSRQQRSRATRFASASGKAVDVSYTQDHIPLNSIPIPADERALFVSLKLLQNKVAELEFSKAEAEGKLQEIVRENVSLKANKSRQKEQYHRSNVSTVEEADYGRSSGKLARIETANLALQNRLDIAERKIQVHETALKNITEERDSAISQLGIAYLNSQDLKKEIETLRVENIELKSQLRQLSYLSQDLRGRGVENYQVTDQTQSDIGVIMGNKNMDDEQHQSKQGIELNRRPRESNVNTQDGKSRKGVQENSHARISAQVNKEVSKIEGKLDDELFSLDLRQDRSATSKMDRWESSTRLKHSSNKKEPNISKQRVKRVTVEDIDMSEPVEPNMDGLTQDGLIETTDRDLTLLSFIDSHEIAQLRRILEAERISRKQREAVLARDPVAIGPSGSGRQSGLTTEFPRKSALKEPSEKVTRPTSAAGELPSANKVGHDGRGTLERQRRYSEQSVHGQNLRRKTTEEMTSAFIIPDITLSQADNLGRPLLRLSEPGQGGVLDSNAQHNGTNCTVCKRLIPSPEAHSHGAGNSRGAITIPKPVPVSSRMPEPSVYNEEPTLRPSQPPAVALATVLKGLEDELAHLKMQLSSCQSAYNKHSASVSKRQRKSLHRKIELLLKEIDTKADQIYALYDVLEGQKQDGHEMTEQEIEVTLQSIGLCANEGNTINLTGASNPSSSKALQVDDDTEDEDEELPWEGIESTVDMTSGSIESRSRK